jgi:hypothetical protein
MRFLTLREFFGYTFLHSRAWLLFGMLYGLWLVAMAGFLVVGGKEVQRHCDAFIVNNHVMDAGMDYYMWTYKQGDPMVAEGGLVGCRVVDLGEDRGSEVYGIYQLSKKDLLISPWFLKPTLGGLGIILILQYVYCMRLKWRTLHLRRLQQQRPYG